MNPYDARWPDDRDRSLQLERPWRGRANRDSDAPRDSCDRGADFVAKRDRCSQGRPAGRRTPPSSRWARLKDSTREQGVNDPVLCSRRSPDLRVVGSFTPCASMFKRCAQCGARVRARLAWARALLRTRKRPSRGQFSRSSAASYKALRFAPTSRVREARASEPSVCARGLDGAAAERGLWAGA
jgi:hypothetical protein